MFKNVYYYKYVLPYKKKTKISIFKTSVLYVCVCVI